MRHSAKIRAWKIRRNEKGKWEEVLRHFGVWEGMLREAFYTPGLEVGK